MIDLLVIGGGAAGFFGAVTAAKHARSNLKIVIVEQGKSVLQKVRISGGGRCNVTHGEFDPRALVTHYPRGQKELRGPFSKFAPGDTMDWFEQRGVPLKIESDGRVFPVSDSSESIIHALEHEARKYKISILLSTKVTGLEQTGSTWTAHFRSDRHLSAKQVLVSTGSAPSVFHMLANLGLQIVPPVPSLFSFNIKNSTLHGLQGLSQESVRIRLPELPLETTGPVVITHWGLSGPAVLKASAIGAIALHRLSYQTTVQVSWTGMSLEEVRTSLNTYKAEAKAQTLAQAAGLPLSKRLYRYLVDRAGLKLTQRWAELTKAELFSLAKVVAEDNYRLEGTTRFKEEFVTAGGIELSEIDFTSFRVRRYENLYAAGEVLNIDGVTGGFNFQNAWTGGYLAGKSIASSYQ